MTQSFKESEDKMQKCVDATRAEFSSIRTGRATPALLDRLHVEAYGASVPLKQVAGVSVPDSRSLLIQAFDRGTVGEIRKAIEKSDLGLTPNIDGNTIRLVIPPLNEERRRDLVRVVKKKGEDGKVAVRNVRHKTHDDLKGQLKDHAITEDENKRMQDQTAKNDRSIHQGNRSAHRGERKRNIGSLTAANELMPLEDIILMPEVQARRVLRGRPLMLRVLAPLGPHAGRGKLRVLRAAAVNERVELVCGYEAYDRL